METYGSKSSNDKLEIICEHLSKSNCKKISGDSYIDRDIRDEINKKINTINKTRNSRINASTRLYNYAESWELLFFVYNTLAVLYVMFSLVYIQSAIFHTISAFFTLYVILLQYYISKKNFKERALRFHYHQLELEKNIQALKSLLIKKEPPVNNEDMKKKYLNIMEKYNLNLINIENHDNIDYHETLRKLESNKDVKNKALYFNEEKIFIITNWILIIGLITTLILFSIYK